MVFVKRQSGSLTLYLYTFHNDTCERRIIKNYVIMDPAVATLADLSRLCRWTMVWEIEIGLRIMQTAFQTYLRIMYHSVEKAQLQNFSVYEATWWLFKQWTWHLDFFCKVPILRPDHLSTCCLAHAQFESSKRQAFAFLRFLPLLFLAIPVTTSLCYKSHLYIADLYKSLQQTRSIAK